MGLTTSGAAAGAGTAISGTGFTASLTGNTLVVATGNLLSGQMGATGASAIIGSGFHVVNRNNHGSFSSRGSSPVPYGISGGLGIASLTGAAGTGGAGIDGSGFTVENSGDVYGGAGGITQTGTAGSGGAGIAGSGFTVTNTGKITGGAGGSVYAKGAPGTGTGVVTGLGGAGVSSLGGATVINEGTISGSASGAGQPAADAIDFTGGGNTLELVAGHPGTFNGAIVVTRAAGDAADTLELGGDTGSDTFDLSQMGSGAIYGGFNAGAKTGDSTWTLQGSDTHTATWNVEAGTLVVGDDSHASTNLGAVVAVAKGATITGNGTVGGLDLSGTLSPGGSIGTFHVDGNATFESGSTFNVEANPDGKADQLAATGKVTIKGGNTLALVQPGKWAPSTTFKIITAGNGVSGTFTGVSDDQAFLTPTLAYGVDNVTLTLVRNNVNFGSVATTPNQKAAAGGIEGTGFGNPLYDAVVKLDAVDARSAFDQTSGEYHASQQTARIDDSRYIREAMEQRLRQGDTDAEATQIQGTQVTAWAHGWGHWGTTDSDGNAAKLADNGDGLLIGADMPVGTGRIGVTGGASRNSLSINQRNSWGRETSTWLGAFGGFNMHAFSLCGGIAYAWDQVPGNRSINFPGYSDRLSGNASGDTLTGFIEGAWTFKFGQTSISPYLNLAHTRVETDASTEAGGAAALHAFGHTENVSFSTLGARGEILLVHHLDVHGELGWQHAYGDTTPNRELQFVAGGPAFTEYGVPIAKNAGVGRIGLGWHHGNVTLDANYEGLSGGGVQDQAARFNVSVAF